MPWQLVVAAPHPHGVVVASRAISAAHVPAFWPPTSASTQAPSHSAPLAGAACHATTTSAGAAVGACEGHVSQCVGRRCCVSHCLGALVLRDDLPGAGVGGALAVAVVLAGCSAAGDSEG
jgi:hypothetical protein